MKSNSAYLVKARGAKTWSGPGPGDPENPALGHECVFSRSLAHPFLDRAEAEAEAATYSGPGAVLVPVKAKPIEASA